jgi:hypothetical protein
LHELSLALEGKSTPDIEQWLALQPLKQQKKDQRVHPPKKQGGPNRYDIKVLLNYLNSFVRK